MATPVHATTITGSRGELKAQVIFTDIGWAPPAKFSQDIGDDLITFARDPATAGETAAAWDVSAPVFLQVKASEQDYVEPRGERDGEPGWWFTESNTYHFDHWLAFGLPYLLVLVDVTNQIAYWAEVNGNAIVATGKGRKIFVPATQRVDADNLEALTKVATSRRKYALEGSVWDGSLNDLGPADRLRNALVLPRLVAPHPNKAATSLTFEEAVAMIMRNRYPELVRRANSGQCPEPKDWATHKEWGWRFVDSILELVTEGSAEPFQQLADKARHRFERDACIVVQACAAYTNHDAIKALAALAPSKATKPADRGWIHAQRATLLFELDKPAEAAAAAKKALFALKSLDGDLSVSVIRGSAATVLYSTAGFAAGDVQATVTALDNAGSWWRAQEVSWALEKDLKLRFEGWTDNNSVHFIHSTSRADLTIIGWNAAFSGAWASWRHLATTSAQLTFTSSDDRQEFEEALSALIFVGEKKFAKNAATKMWRAGPIAPLQRVVDLLARSTWLKRDEGATLAVFAAGGDLLSHQAADKVVERILEVLAADGDVRVHGGSWSDRWIEVDSALRTILKAATAKSHRKVADLITDNFVTCAESTAYSLVHIAERLSAENLDSARLSQLVGVAKAREDRYGISLLMAVATYSGAAAAELQAHAKASEHDVLRSFLVAGSQKHDDFIKFGRSAARTVKKMVVDAQRKSGTAIVAHRADDPLDDLVIAALKTGDTKLWKVITDALESRVVEETQQQGAIRRLAYHFSNLPRHVQRKLRKLAAHLKGASPGIAFGTKQNDFRAAVLHLQIATGFVADLEVEAKLLAQLRDDPVGFVKTLSAWNAEHKLPFLSTMVVAENPGVRAQAAYSLLEHAHRYPADRERAHSVLHTALIQDEGCSLRDAVAQGLVAYPDKALASLEAELRDHPSATVRSRFVDNK